MKEYSRRTVLGMLLATAVTPKAAAGNFGTFYETMYSEMLKLLSQKKVIGSDAQVQVQELFIKGLLDYVGARDISSDDNFTLEMDEINTDQRLLAIDIKHPDESVLSARADTLARQFSAKKAISDYIKFDRHEMGGNHFNSLRIRMRADDLEAITPQVVSHLNKLIDSGQLKVDGKVFYNKGVLVPGTVQMKGFFPNP